MALDPGSVGTTGAPVERSWDSTDCLLYALGVGAGGEDDELAFTTENSVGVAQRVLPTFALVAARGAGAVLQQAGEFDAAQLVHGAQALRLHREIPVAGTARSTARIAAVYDKGSAGVVVIETATVDAGSGEPLFDSTSTLFIRGAGGFGGARGPSVASTDPGRPPDHVVTYTTHPHQALLYRLSGDRNPLHSDPAFARRAGFPRPILHGLCTFGFAGRALLRELCSSDPAQFASMEARFSKPVFPGDDITVSMWVDGGDATFRAESRGSIVLEAGTFAR